jgi:hypothetical protein
MILRNMAQPLQRRRANMHQQLSLWPQEKSHQPDIWQNLTPNSKNYLIAALARLIAKAVLPPEKTQSQEVNHEP